MLYICHTAFYYNMHKFKFSNVSKISFCEKQTNHWCVRFSELLQCFFALVRTALLCETEQFHVLGEVTGRITDVHGCFLFVPCQHPHLKHHKKHTKRSQTFNSQSASHYSS